MQKEKSSYKEERTDLVVGIITIVAVLALFVWLMVSVSNNSKANMGQITADGTVRRGTEQTFVYSVGNASIKDGTDVIWTVNGKKVAQSKYAKGQPISMKYTPDTSGKITVKATAGKYGKQTVIDVQSPQMTLVAPNITVEYGEKLPELHYAVEGLLPDEEQDFVCDGRCKVNADKLDAGIYTVEIDGDCSYKDYEVTAVTGTVTVLPKKLTVTNCIQKEYDGSNKLTDAQLQIDGILAQDEVYAQFDALYFDNKNVGENKQVMLANVQLGGKDARNYVLEGTATGKITSKYIDLVGLSVKDKTYDGNVKAEIDKMGKLNGVCKGDSVAIGGLKVDFDSADVGDRKYSVSQITLVGADKDNYIVRAEQGEGKIRSSGWFAPKTLDAGNE